ncbi:hypothetical protein TNCV_1443031 [Trichonephila clavipes]|nr:hypothetical protein TNCV_1443031 [Trichonephila clavipes]
MATGSYMTPIYSRSQTEDVWGIGRFLQLYHKDGELKFRFDFGELCALVNKEASLGEVFFDVADIRRYRQPFNHYFLRVERKELLTFFLKEADDLLALISG